VTKRRFSYCVIILICICLVNCSASLSRDAHNELKLGEEALEQESYDEAIKYFTTHLKKFPKDADVHLKLGFVILKKERLREAIDKFKEAINLNPENKEARSLIKNSIFDEAIKFSSKGNEETSMRYLTAYLTIDPDDIDTHLALTKAFIKREDRRNALGSLNKLVALDPHNPEVIALLDFFSEGFH
jgi:tetratricopeptide (TPR) repeat protein